MLSKFEKLSSSLFIDELNQVQLKISLSLFAFYFDTLF